MLYLHKQTKKEIMKAAKIYTWRTKKEGTQFRSVVIEMIPRETANESGSYCDSKRIENANRLFRSRAKAKSYSQIYCKYLKAIA